MVSAAAWVLLKSKTELKSPSTAIPPDYRGPSLEQGENGARFWRLETLETAVRKGQENASESQQLMNRNGLSHRRARRG
jgi:hypothetical protein